MSYKAIIARVHIRPHPNADRIRLGSAAGNQVIVGLDTVDQELGVYFPTDGILNDEYCTVNDLYPVFNENGARIGGGFFDRKRPRVRTQNFRGEKSEGYWAPISSLAYTGIELNLLSEGYEFDELNGHKICEKFYNQATLNAMKGGARSAKKKNIMFPEHEDTKQFRYEMDRIHEGSIITITEKLHGTSGRYAHVLDEITHSDNRPRWKRVLSYLVQVPWELTTSSMEWSRLIGSRRVVLESARDADGGFYGSHEFRHKVAERFMPFMHKGEVIYGEIVGYVDTETPVMQQRAVKGVSELKEIRNKYGEDMIYSYGCKPGECKFYVYRITQVNEDGVVHELSWPQIKARALQLGIEIVPEMAPTFIHEEARGGFGPAKIMLKEKVDNLMEGSSTLDPRHIREGVVVRVDQPNGETKFLKAKSFEFGLLEGYIKSEDTYVDLEEIS